MVTNLKNNAMNVSPRALRRSIKVHCYQSNSQQVAVQLIQWGNLMRSNRGGLNRDYTNLISLSELFKSEQAVQLLKQLDRSLYGSGEIEPSAEGKNCWPGKQFWKSIAPYLKKTNLKTFNYESRGLPSLYSLG